MKKILSITLVFVFCFSLVVQCFAENREISFSEQIDFDRKFSDGEIIVTVKSGYAEYDTVFTADDFSELHENGITITKIEDITAVTEEQWNDGIDDELNERKLKISFNGDVIDAIISLDFREDLKSVRPNYVKFSDLIDKNLEYEKNIIIVIKNNASAELTISDFPEIKAVELTEIAPTMIKVRFEGDVYEAVAALDLREDLKHVQPNYIMKYDYIGSLTKAYLSVFINPSDESNEILKSFDCDAMEFGCNRQTVEQIEKTFTVPVTVKASDNLSVKHKTDYIGEGNTITIKIDGNLYTFIGRLTNDANGDGRINLSDVATILKYSAHWDNVVCTLEADFNKDGKINLNDASCLLKLLANWDNPT